MMNTATADNPNLKEVNKFVQMQWPPKKPRIKRKMRESFWWPRMDKDIKEFTKMCFPCQCSNKSMPKQMIPAKASERLWPGHHGTVLQQPVHHHAYRL
ncbi:MAG: hypothetical protein GY740_18420 [Gammaproteobacteria bacterium]|nr:hypothetical protein [Gammaproteobacteria bacterium]